MRGELCSHSSRGTAVSIYSSHFSTFLYIVNVCARHKEAFIPVVLLLTGDGQRVCSGGRSIDMRSLGSLQVNNG